MREKQNKKVVKYTQIRRKLERFETDSGTRSLCALCWPACVHVVCSVAVEPLYYTLHKHTTHTTYSELMQKPDWTTTNRNVRVYGYVFTSQPSNMFAVRHIVLGRQWYCCYNVCTFCVYCVMYIRPRHASHFIAAHVVCIAAYINHTCSQMLFSTQRQNRQIVCAFVVTYFHRRCVLCVFVCEKESVLETC